MDRDLRPKHDVIDYLIFAMFLVAVVVLVVFGLGYQTRLFDKIMTP